MDKKRRKYGRSSGRNERLKEGGKRREEGKEQGSLEERRIEEKKSSS